MKGRLRDEMKDMPSLFHERFGLTRRPDLADMHDFGGAAEKLAQNTNFPTAKEAGTSISTALQQQQQQQETPHLRGQKMQFFFSWWREAS